MELPNQRGTPSSKVDPFATPLVLLIIVRTISAKFAAKFGIKALTMPGGTF